MSNFAVILLAIASVCPIYAQEHPCTNAEAERAEMQADTSSTWDALYKSYKAYHHCDDGAIAEGYSESVTRMLARQWSTLPQLLPLAQEDAAFGAFVIRHVDATADLDNLKTIVRNAKMRCPSNSIALCTEVRKRAEVAIKELADLGIK